MKVKDFKIIPVLCPIGMEDCSPCKHAGSFKVRNPPCTGGGNPDFGEHECRYIEWFTEEYAKKEKEIR